MTKEAPRKPARREVDLNPGWKPGERPNRDTEDWLETIGPEDMEREEVVDFLEEYGFELQDQDERISLPSGKEVLGFEIEDGDDPDVVGDELGSTPVDAEDNTSLRPVEDEAIEDLQDD